MTEKIHHIGMAVHSLEDARVILSDDHVCAWHSDVSRRNLGWSGVVGQVARASNTPPRVLHAGES
jgi:hypothetical protein